MTKVWIPCQRIAQGHNGNSRPVRLVSWQFWWWGWQIIKKWWFWFHGNEVNLWEWEVCGKVKAAKFREGTVDKGKSQNLNSKVLVWVIWVKSHESRVGSHSQSHIQSQGQNHSEQWTRMRVKTSVQLDCSNFIWSFKVRSVKPGTCKGQKWKLQCLVPILLFTILILIIAFCTCFAQPIVATSSLS